MDNTPLVSYCVFAYNQEDYIEEAINSAFAQEYDNLEIVISDDCSRDKTWDIINTLVNNYQGEHKVVLNRNKFNMGIGSNMSNTLFNIATGDYLILADGDDISLPERTSLSVEKIEHLKVDSLSFNQIYINSKSEKTGSVLCDVSNTSIVYTLNDYVKGKLGIVPGASRIITRRLLAKFGPLNDDCPTEDTTFTFRALLLGGVGVCFMPLVLYRRHENNTSSFENLYAKIDPKTIYAQYKKDLEIGYCKDLVVEDEYERIKDRIKTYLRRERFVRRFYGINDFFKLLIYIFLLLFNKDFRMVEIKVIIKTKFRNILRIK